MSSTVYMVAAAAAVSLALEGVSRTAAVSSTLQSLSGTVHTLVCFPNNTNCVSKSMCFFKIVAWFIWMFKGRQKHSAPNNIDWIYLYSFNY